MSSLEAHNKSEGLEIEVGFAIISWYQTYGYT